LQEDADAYAKSLPSESLSVKATALDDAFYTLIQKKTKLSSFVEGVAAGADPSATYLLQPSLLQMQNVPEEWKQTHTPNDVPLFRVSTLAFSKSEGLEFPLFTRKEDAIAAFERLQSSKKAEDPSSTVKQAELQVTSILDLVQLFSMGGFEGRYVG
jgi:hypothetical protein